MIKDNMVSGFSFIKHGLTLEYPILESVQSIDPLCDEVVINVGFETPECDKDDGTYEYLRDNLTGERYKFIKSWWDPSIMSRGLILSQQTNIAMGACKGSIGQYIQGDEAIHEDDLPLIEEGIRKMVDRKEIEGLLYNYTHFFGNTDLYKFDPHSYRKEVRTVRLGIGLESYLDAQGFRFSDGRKPSAIETGARIFHYGWARRENAMSDKKRAFEKLYFGKDHESEEYTYDRIFGLRKFEGTHPALLKSWIEKNHNDVTFEQLNDPRIFANFKNWIRLMVEEYTGHMIGEFRNYKKIK